MRKTTKALASGMLLVVTHAMPALANGLSINDSRAERWEFFLTPQFTNSKLLQFDNGAEADISNRSSLGFGLGYNFNRHMEMTVTFSASSSNYSGTRILDDGNNTKERFNASLYTSSTVFGLSWNLFKTPFTPYLSGSLGYTFIDSGIPTGGIKNVCWWDPWWGYICAPAAQTYTSSALSYGIEAGLRYDVNRKFFVKGGVTDTLIDVDSSNQADFIGYRLAFGFMF